MNQPLLSAETEEISDSTSFSVISLVALVLSLVGILCVDFIQVMPMAILGGALGAFVLWTAKRNRLSFVSRAIGFLAVFVGITSASWGVFHRQMYLDSELVHAREVAEAYLKSLSAGDTATIVYLAGFQVESADESADYSDQESANNRAKKRLYEDPAHVEIRTRRTPAKWVFDGLEGEYTSESGYIYKLTYRDVGQTNPPIYWVFVRKDSAKYDRSRKTVRWFVDTVEQAKQPGA